MNKNSVLISIINWNNPQRTLNCIKMLEAQDYPHKKIVVVDNASQPEALNILRSQIPEQIQIIESIENTGYAGGHALALAMAQAEAYDFFWFLNTDLIIPPQTLSNFIQVYEQYGTALYGSVPLQGQADTKFEDYLVLFHWKFFQTNYREHIFSLKPFARLGDLLPTGKPIEVSALSGSSIFIPMDILAKYGFMDTSFFMYSEEIDYCFRLKEAGVRSIAVPQAYVFHEREGSSKTYKQLHSVINYYRFRNQIIRVKRYGSRFDLLQIVIKDLLLIIFYLLYGSAGFEKARFALVALVDGLNNKLGKTYAPEDYIFAQDDESLIS